MLCENNDSNAYTTFAPFNCHIRVAKTYFEVECVSVGANRIGVVIPTKFTLRSNRMRAIGSDAASWGYDGRSCKVYAANNELPALPMAAPWQPTDRAGVAVDLTTYQILFSLNGTVVASAQLLCPGSSFVDGDPLLPAVALDTREKCSFFFEKDQLRHLPADFTPLQQNASPAYMLAPIKRDPAAPCDALDSEDAKHALTAAVAAIRSGNGTAESPLLKEMVENFFVTRGGLFEYGLDYSLKRLDPQDVMKAFAGGK